MEKNDNKQTNKQAKKQQKTTIGTKYKNLELFLTLAILRIATIHYPVRSVQDGTVFSFGLLPKKRGKFNKGFELHSNGA